MQPQEAVPGSHVPEPVHSLAATRQGCRVRTECQAEGLINAPLANAFHQPAVRVSAGRRGIFRLGVVVADIEHGCQPAADQTDLQRPVVDQQDFRRGHPGIRPGSHIDHVYRVESLK